jgi:hypothetical protein
MMTAMESIFLISVLNSPRDILKSDISAVSPLNSNVLPWYFINLQHLPRTIGKSLVPILPTSHVPNLPLCDPNLTGNGNVPKIEQSKADYSSY